MTMGIAATNRGWVAAPIGDGAGAALRPARDEQGAAVERINTRVGDAPTGAASLLAGATLGAGGIAAIAGSGSIASRIGVSGAGKWLGVALGVGALAGAALLIARGAGASSTEHMVPFRHEPDLDGVAPGDVYATLRAHHERYAPAVERELATLLDEGKVRSYSGIIGANGFVADVVNRHRVEVEQRLEALDSVGDVQEAALR